MSLDQLCSTFLVVVPELETDEVVPMVLFGEDTHLLLQDQTRRYRDRRSPQDVPGGHDTTHKDHLLLLLPAFGNNLYLNLRSDNSFLSDNFVVEERKRGKSPQLSRIPQGQLCFYTGWIVNHTDSYASLSTCGGLVGQHIHHLFSFQLTFYRCIKLA